jgi:hypothetical protein
MMKQTLGARVSLLALGSGCIAEAGNPSEPAAPAVAAAATATARTAEDMPLPPGLIAGEKKEMEICRDTCLEHWYDCAEEANAYRRCVCANEIDACLGACGFTTGGPETCIPEVGLPKVVVRPLD